MARTNQARRSSGASAEPRFREHSLVSLKNPVEVDGNLLPAGTQGTIVAAYRDGVGFEVEFFEPVHAVVTLEADNLLS